jgi:hypothetical protein
MAAEETLSRPVLGRALDATLGAILIGRDAGDTPMQKAARPRGGAAAPHGFRR